MLFSEFKNYLGLQVLMILIINVREIFAMCIVLTYALASVKGFDVHLPQSQSVIKKGLSCWVIFTA